MENVSRNKERFLSMTKTIEKLARKRERTQSTHGGVLPHIMALNFPRFLRAYDIWNISHFSYNIAVVINRGNNGRKKQKKEMESLEWKILLEINAYFALESFSRNAREAIERHSLPQASGNNRGRGTRLEIDLHVSTSRAIPSKRLRIKLTFNSFPRSLRWKLRSLVYYKRWSNRSSQGGIESNHDMMKSAIIST